MYKIWMRAYCDFCYKSVRILQFLGHNCVYIVISKIWKNYRIHDGEFDHQKDSTIFGIHNTSQKKVRSSSVCRLCQFLTSDDLNVWKFQQLSQKKDIISSLCCIRQFLPQMIWMFGIPATIVLNWLVLNLYPLYFAVGLRNFIEGSVWKFEKEKTPCNFVPLSKQGFECYVRVFE